MKVKIIALFLFFYGCIPENNEFQDIIISHESVDGKQTIKLKVKGKNVYDYPLIDFKILTDTIDYLNRQLLKKSVNRFDCSWSDSINKISLDECFSDIKNFNSFIKRYLGLKKKVSFKSDEGRILLNLIIDSNFPLFLKSTCIVQTDTKWLEIESKYQGSIMDSLNLEKIKKNSQYSDEITVSDYCSFNFNRKVILQNQKDSNFFKIMLCVLPISSIDNKIKSNLVNSSELFFQFEQYIDSEGYLQLKKRIMNPYSLNRIRHNRFE